MQRTRVLCWEDLGPGIQNLLSAHSSKHHTLKLSETDDFQEPYATSHHHQKLADHLFPDCGSLFQPWPFLTPPPPRGYSSEAGKWRLEKGCWLTRGPGVELGPTWVAGYQKKKESAKMSKELPIVQKNNRFSDLDLPWPALSHPIFAIFGPFSAHFCTPENERSITIQPPTGWLEISKTRWCEGGGGPGLES